jgi:hypothetical protein
MDQNANAAASKAIAFAGGLQKNVAVTGRRWTQWPGGAGALAHVTGCIDWIRGRLQAAANADDGAALVAACVSDLRAILEWTTYQSAALATARAIGVARKARAFAQEFGLLADPAARLLVLVDSEESRIENVRIKNDDMQAIAERNPHLSLPRPLVSVESLAPKPPKRPGRLDLIAQLKKAAKGK